MLMALGFHRAHTGSTKRELLKTESPKAPCNKGLIEERQARRPEVGVCPLLGEKHCQSLRKARWNLPLSSLAISLPSQERSPV